LALPSVLAWGVQNKDKAYLITLIWAYTGILIKHTPKEGFASQYMMVIVATCLALAVFVVCLGFFFKQQKNMKKN
jgi:drug/metabolite transporter (DMT)-like permease